ncbi:MAG: GTP-binding protein [Bacteroidales bacterium]
MNKGKINIGILAHVDAGKTTLTEQFLYYANASKVLGNVDKGSTITDSLNIEKERGISVFSSSVHFAWNNVEFNLIDTPGHIDFSAEVERSLMVMDLAVLVISAVEGVQGHTYNIVDQLKEMQIPFVVFLNKIDRKGSDYLSILEEITKELGLCVFCKNFPLNEANAKANVMSFDLKSDEQRDLITFNMEMIAESDDMLMEQYLEGQQWAENEINDIVIDSCKTQKLVPLYLGVAKNGIGIDEFLSFLSSFAIAEEQESKDLSALVFKVEHHDTLGRIAFIRIFSGSLKPKDVFYNSSQKKEQKVAQLKKKHLNKLEDVRELFAGDIGIITGVPDIQIADIIGVPNRTLCNMQLPVLEYKVEANEEKDYSQLAEALSLLNLENPKLNFQWFKDYKEFQVNLLGNIQKEVLEQHIYDRFGIGASFVNPTVIYKETPSSKAVGTARYTMPKPCWAVVSFLIEPGELDSGIVYKSEVGVNKIAAKYQNEIERTIEKSLKQGVKGWEVTDLKITLVDGEDHEVHSRPGDFILATPMAIMDALTKANTSFLEPIQSFEIKAEEYCLGSVVSELNAMRASFDAPSFENNSFQMKGKVPVSTSVDFAVKFGMLTSGKGKLKMKLLGYDICEDKNAIPRPYKGVNPLDRSQWILHNRGAFRANDRKI